jgi:ribulose-phosphate 3-epimerase
MRVAPSLLAADFSQLKTVLANAEQAGADWLHWDVMDGHFVANLTFGAGVIQAARPHSSLPFDVHLMVAHPEQCWRDFANAGADHITLHIEACPSPTALLQEIASSGRKVGLSLRPATPVEALLPWLPLVDQVLVMTVEPGFGGQAFLHEQLAKIERLAHAIAATQRPIELVVDGGINPTTGQLVAQAGATVVVAGSSVFTAPTHGGVTAMDVLADNIARLRSGDTRA